MSTSSSSVSPSHTQSVGPAFFGGANSLAVSSMLSGLGPLGAPTFQAPVGTSLSAATGMALTLLLSCLVACLIDYLLAYTAHPCPYSQPCRLSLMLNVTDCPKLTSHVLPPSVQARPERAARPSGATRAASSALTRAACWAAAAAGTEIWTTTSAPSAGAGEGARTTSTRCPRPTQTSHRWATVRIILRSFLSPSLCVCDRLLQCCSGVTIGRGYAQQYWLQYTYKVIFLQH